MVVYTKYALKKAIQGYAREKENLFEDGRINWNYVSADACIVYGDEFSTDEIYEVLEEVADEIEGLANV